MNSYKKPKYTTKNWKSYNAALCQRGSVTIWFDPKMSWEAEPSGKRGRRQAYSEAAIQSCLTLKVVFGMALRQTTGFVASVLKLTGLDWSVPDFSTLCRRQKALTVRIPYRGSKGPLHLLIDSTGIKVSGGGEGEWLRHKHGCQKRCQWRKLHLAIDEATLEIGAVEVTGAGVGDAPILPELLEQISPEQEIESVTADGAYDTCKCFEAIAERGAFAVIPPRKNAALWKPKNAGAVARNEGVKTIRYLGGSLWKLWSGYNRRSCVETKMHCLKRLGTGVMARAFDSQVTDYTSGPSCSTAIRLLAYLTLYHPRRSFLVRATLTKKLFVQQS